MLTRFFTLFLFVPIELLTLRPMPHFKPAIDYLLAEFPKMVEGYITDYSYQMATVLDPIYGPTFFRDFGGGKILFNGTFDSHN